MTFVFYFLYDLILYLLIPFIWVGAFFNDKLGGSYSGQKELKLKLSQFNTLVGKDPKPVIWLHAASAGEFEQIKPLLARFSQQDVYIFQTFTSPTIYYKVSQNKLFHGVSFLPWDTPARVAWFIKTLNPVLFLNTRHDIWPNLLRALHKNQVRSILINANLYQDSTRLKPVFRTLNRCVFQYIDAIYTGSDSLKILLDQLYPGPISVVGDSRFDQVHERALTNNSELISENIISDRRVIVYGSVIESDRELVTATISKSLETSKYLHIVVPHEVGERQLTPWEVDFFRKNVKTIRLTDLDEYAGEPVLIWNHVGQLADLYKYASLAYVGAGFGAGVHSVTEPAIYHVPAAHGPKYDILAEAIELVDLGLSHVTTTTDELVQFLQLSDDELHNSAARIKTFVDQRVGASDFIFKQEYPPKG